MDVQLSQFFNYFHFHITNLQINGCLNNVIQKNCIFTFYEVVAGDAILILNINTSIE